MSVNKTKVVKKQAYSNSKKRDILDKLGNASSDTKKKIRHESSIGQTSFQDEKSKRDVGRNASNAILNYPIDTEDNIFVRTIIQIINERKINVQWLYNRIYELYGDELGSYEKARSTGYNFIYALTVKKELGIPRMLQWLEILNVKDFDISYRLGSMEYDEEDEEYVDIDEC